MHDRFTRLEELLAMVCFAITSALVFIGALARTAGYPLIWAIDFAQMSFVWACVLGADIALKRNVHIEIDILVRTFSRNARRILAIVFLVMISVFLATLVYLGIKLTLLNLERPLGDVGISYGYVTAAIPVGAFLMMITALRRLYRGLTGQETLSLEGRDGTVL
jgi:TRAP-type C4-dicarboxylate transport system permease small subunit